MVLHVPIKSYHLVNKHRQKDGYGHLPFSNEKLLLLLFRSGSLGNLDSSIFEQRSFYSEQSWANIQSKQEDTTKNNTPKQKKDFKKSILKDRARCYGYESARNTENGARTWKLWDKQ